MSLEEAYTGVTRRITIHGRQEEVLIPPGADNGTVIQVEGAGKPGRNGGRPGDLMLTAHVEDDDRFERDGDDLWVKARLEVRSDGLVEVPTLRGIKQITVHAGARTGNQLRLTGLGMPILGSDNEYGDLHFEISRARDPEQKYITRAEHAQLLREEEKLEAEVAELGRSAGAAQPRESKVKKNAEFEDLQDKQAMKIMELSQIYQTLQDAKVVDAPKTATRIVLGSTVVIREKDEKENKVYKMVSRARGDNGTGSISADSPAGRALMGKTVGDKVRVRTPDGIMRMEIIEIR